MASPLKRLGICCRVAAKLCNTPPSVLVYGRRTFLPKYVRPTLSAIAARKKKLKPSSPEPRSSYLEWNYPAELHAFAARLGEAVDESRLREALTERCYVVQQQLEHERLGLPDVQPATPDNTALAARGLSVMTSYVAGWLRSALPRMPEEGVQAVSSYLTSQDRLLDIASGIGMKDIILTAEYPPSEETMARALQAFVGVMADCCGEKRSHLFVRDFVLTRLANTDINVCWEIENPLNILTDTLQRCGRGPPEPRLLRCAGPDSLLAAYVVGIYSDKRLFSSAPGETVSEAVTLAARVGLNQLMDVSENSTPLDFEVERAAVLSPAPSLAVWRPL